MNRQHFNEELEKLELRKPRTVEVLRMVLTRRTDAEVAKSLDIHQGTIRKHIEKLYAAFGIKSEFEGDRRSKRGDLVALFAKYKPEWVHDCSPAATNEVSDEEKKANLNGLSQPVSSSSTKDSEAGENLRALALTMLTQLGFDETFEVSEFAQHRGYQLKNPGKGAKPYQLILVQQKEKLFISIAKEILDRYSLIFQYREYFDLAGEICPFTKGRFWILPSKKAIFLQSLDYYYWNLLKVEGKTMGIFYLDKLVVDDDNSELVIPQIPLEKFNPETLSSRDTYLVLNEDNLFPNTWQVCISSREVLREFIDHFGKILIESQ
ncbi:hypothetical protein NDA03_09420 [Trichocoleus sp. Lan]|uniref:helix-turn-helix transcriptional regulator n=1 Tax=Cyanophyceae TaxID=3028117 RepID=UPI0016868A77|nr:hypothetical protein [Coleofasciculus sp. FACHB-542]MBD2084322.1 hypothetical protein [Coleofasciculus sp. FACHB-542]